MSLRRILTHENPVPYKPVYSLLEHTVSLLPGENGQKKKGSASTANRAEKEDTPETIAL